MERMFEKASRLKLRFPSERGALGVEDLWDLPLTSNNGVSLDNVAKALSREVKESEEESFVVQATKAKTELTLKFDIVKHVISTRLAENEARQQALVRKGQKEKIRSIIDKKQDEKLEDMSIEDLKKLAEE